MVNILIKVNDYVSRISYNHDVIFKVISIDGDLATIVGHQKRLVATALITDLVLVDDEKLHKDIEVSLDRIKGIKRFSRYKMHMTGKILHIDSDKDYLEKCLDLYEEL